MVVAKKKLKFCFFKGLYFYLYSFCLSMTA